MSKMYEITYSTNVSSSRSVTTVNAMNSSVARRNFESMNPGAKVVRVRGPL
jgi:hypothetical protein